MDRQIHRTRQQGMRTTRAWGGKGTGGVRAPFLWDGGVILGARQGAGKGQEGSVGTVLGWRQLGVQATEAGHLLSLGSGKPRWAQGGRGARHGRG